MRLHRLALVLAASLGLAACAESPIKQGVVYDRVSQELKQATNERNQRSVDLAEKSLMPALTLEMPKSAEEQRFDLSVINAPAPQVFMALVTGTRYNMLVTPEVAGNITVKLKDVTVKEALEAIRELYGYEFNIQGNRISIQPNTLQTRMFQVNYLASRRQGATELRVTSSAIAGSTAAAGGTSTPTGTGTASSATAGTGGSSSAMGNLTSRVQTSTDSDFWGSMSAALATLVGNGDGRSVVVSPQSGVIVVRAFPREIRAVENYLKATQTVIERQVMLEAKIVDVTLSQDFQAGVNWAAFGSGDRGSKVAVGVSGATTTLNTTASNRSAGALSSTDTSTVTPGTFGSVVATALGKGFFGLAFQTASFAALLNFLESQGSVSVLSSPRISSMNNQKAVLKVGTDELFVTNVTTSTTSTSSGSVSTPSLTLQPYFSGISLDVTPQIDEDDNIILHVHPAVSVVQEKEKTIDLGATLGQFKLPLAASSVNETDSIVRARNGNIIAIGGLMREEQSSSNNQLPGAGRAGSAAALLGQKSNSMSKRELVILLKPTIIQDDRAWVRDIEQSAERLRALDPRQFAIETHY
jgi:MSHA biogenesis protein MshL